MTETEEKEIGVADGAWVGLGLGLAVGFAVALVAAAGDGLVVGLVVGLALGFWGGVLVGLAVGLARRRVQVRQRDACQAQGDPMTHHEGGASQKKETD